MRVVESPNENQHFDWIRLSKAYKYLDEKYRRVMSHDTEEWRLNKNWFGSKNDMSNSLDFNLSIVKSGNLHFDVLLLPIAYKVLA